MAYNKDDRFPKLPYPVRLLEPGSYQDARAYKVKLNKAPFLSRCERKTMPGNTIWTHAIYYADPKQKIPNCTSLMSKKPRFPYEALSKEDIEAILCRCGLGSSCECADENEQETEVNCGAKINKRLFKGPPPRAVAAGLSVPSKRDHGFQEMPDGTFQRIFKREVELSPTFYDSKVNETTAFYHGCKWSQWTSSRAMKALERRPGPADYQFERIPSFGEQCAENVRAERRKYSKQLRYIEILQQRNLLEGRPGPATYSPKYPMCSDFKYSGSKAERFLDSTAAQGPGPFAHWIKRDFDLPEPPIVPCLARLPEPSFFGIKAQRFKPWKEEGPSPATYSPSDKQRPILNCSQAPFGSSARRFKKTIWEDLDDEEDRDEKTEECPKPTWPFKSKTIRMKSLGKKRMFEQSPADLPMEGFREKRKNQSISPFFSSEGRFQPWYDWLAVYGRLNTPGPGYYNLENNRCTPAVCRGPLFRCQRFPPSSFQTPAPNEYVVGNGVETVFCTFNQKLIKNLEDRKKQKWNVSKYKNIEVPQKLSLFDQEALILDKAIVSLDVESETGLNKPDAVKETPDFGERSPVIAPDGKPKLLRSFMYRQSVKPAF